MNVAVALSDKKSDDTGRVDRRGTEVGGVARGELEGLLPVEATDSGLVLEVADAFKLVGTGPPPLGGTGPDGAAVIARYKESTVCSPGYRHAS